MQFLDITSNRKDKPKANPVPVQDYLERLKYILYDVEFDVLFISTEKESLRENVVYIGEL